MQAQVFDSVCASGVARTRALSSLSAALVSMPPKGKAKKAANAASQEARRAKAKVMPKKKADSLIGELFHVFMGGCDSA